MCIIRQKQQMQRLKVTTYGYRLISNDVRRTVYCLGLLEALGASDLVHYKILFVKYSVPSSCDAFMFSINTE